MRSFIALGAVASLLTAAGCNRQDQTPAPAQEAVPATDSAADAAATGSAAGSPGGSSAGAPSPEAAPPYPAPEASSAPDAGGPSPVTDATRDGAKEKAETTNLHPKTN